MRESRDWPVITELNIVRSCVGILLLDSGPTSVVESCEVT